MLFTKVDEDDENQDRNALTSLGSWDLLGLGAATLVASPATIHPRRRMPLVSQPAVHATTGTGLSSMEMDDDKLQQDSFLKRFADIKQSKGEADQHTLSTLQGKTTAEGRALAPVRKGGPRPKALTQSSKSSPRGTRSRAASNASTPASQPDDSQNSSAPATFNAWANFASPPITRPPPPVFPGFPAQNLREDDPGEPAEEES
ncbi:hypothetical protein EJ08DRAFT_227988 [Tothia fuscella]|uniref:Uncharacterized protein n=1 Tax=Tothia fuscella TaxID=1048955 RepID=A0A9P4P2M8_9PEZI|nr:hypothetical protein EJ08DRAFT_227988 [Tothia fuscella]